MSSLGGGGKKDEGEDRVESSEGEPPCQTKPEYDEAASEGGHCQASEVRKLFQFHAPIKGVPLGFY